MDGEPLCNQNTNSSVIIRLFRGKQIIVSIFFQTCLLFCSSVTLSLNVQDHAQFCNFFFVSSAKKNFLRLSQLYDLKAFSESMSTANLVKVSASSGAFVLKPSCNSLGSNFRATYILYVRASKGLNQF